MTVQWIEAGSPHSPIWLVGEAPGEEEVAQGRPFVGVSGYELGKMLADAGINKSDCFQTNVCHVRPPSYTKNGKVVNNDINQFFVSAAVARRTNLSEVAGRYPTTPIREGLDRLGAQIAQHRPQLIIALGNTAMWALAGEMGITKWRGSILLDTNFTSSVKVIPTFHPADILRQWTHRPIAVQDFRRALRESEFPEVRRPAWEFVVEPSRADIADWFNEYARDSSRPLVCDTEGWGRVDCIGFASDPLHAICIPFKHETREPLYYWSEEDEFDVTQTCRTVLSSRPIIFHNALWDIQVIARRWGLVPGLYADTQVAQHVAFPGLLGGKIDPVTGEVDKKGSSLSLSFIASMYCEYYRYWKDDGRNFDAATGDELTYWRYNCEDCVRTYECWEVLERVLDSSHLTEQFWFEMRLFAPVLSMMFRGINYDRARRQSDRRWFGSIERPTPGIRTAMTGKLQEVGEWINAAVGCDFNPDSGPQMRALFYDDLKLPVKKNRKTGAPTLDDAALDSFKRQNPLLYPLITQIQNYRTLDTLRSSLDVQLTPTDHRYRTVLNIGFVETMRFSSNETAFGEGGNLQNIKRPDDD